MISSLTGSHLIGRPSKYYQRIGKGEVFRCATLTDISPQSPRVCPTVGFLAGEIQKYHRPSIHCTQLPCMREFPTL